MAVELFTYEGGDRVDNNQVDTFTYDDLFKLLKSGGKKGNYIRTEPQKRWQLLFHSQEEITLVLC